MSVEETTVVLKGLTWDDPRGWGPLAEIDRAFPGNATVQWDIQPLEGFESKPIVELARQYDILNLDHPHIGEAAEAGALCAVTDLQDEYVGPSLASYVWGGQCWAVPVDAACMALAYNIRAIAAPPRSYADVYKLADVATIGISLAGVHSLMAFLALLAQYDEPLSDDAGAAWPEPRAFDAAANQLYTLAKHSLPASLDWNPLQAFEALRRGVCDLVPLTFAYSSACKDDIAFAPIPSLNTDTLYGAVLGGTGLAVSAHSQNSDAALQYTKFAGSKAAQSGLWAQNGGQPASRAAWQALSKSEPFYRDLLPAMNAAWVRPRYPGWNKRQTEAGAAINHWLRRANSDPNELRTALEEIWANTVSHPNVT